MCLKVAKYAVYLYVEKASNSLSMARIQERNM